MTEPVSSTTTKEAQTTTTTTGDEGKPSIDFFLFLSTTVESLVCTVLLWLPLWVILKIIAAFSSKQQQQDCYALRVIVSVLMILLTVVALSIIRSRHQNSSRSNYEQRKSTISWLAVSQILLTLINNGPLRLIFCIIWDPFKVRRKFYQVIRRFDTQILQVRPPTYHNIQQLHITIPLRDGEITTATLYMPKAQENQQQQQKKRPVVLIRTPYDRSSLKDWGMRFAERGYNLVAQDTRGRFGSTGNFFPLTEEAADGADTIRWIATQPWCDGNIGITGVSYLGLAAWAAMREEIPNLKAVAPILAATDIYNVMFGRNSGGAAHIELMFRWSYLVINLMTKPFGMIESIFCFFMGTGNALKQAYRHAPLSEVDTKYLCPNLDSPLEWFQDGLNHPLGTEPFWDDKRKFIDLQTIYSNKRLPPILIFAGWYDFFCSEQLHDYMTLQERSKNMNTNTGNHHRLVVGPYTHWHVIAMQPKLFRSLFEFFDEHLLLKIEKNETPSSITTTNSHHHLPVEVYQFGKDMGWRHMDSWPPSNIQMTTMAFVQNQQGENLLLPINCDDEDDIALLSQRETEVSYIYDPSDPTPQLGGGTFDPTNCGRCDQTKIETARQDDMLIFTTEPLNKPLTIAGEIIISLTVESNVEGTDYVGRACHVTHDYREGGGKKKEKSENIADGIIRKFDLKPGQKTKIQISLSPILNRLDANDRLRIHICSSAYPKYGRHLNTRQSFHLEVEKNALISEQTLFLGGKDGGCQVHIPIIPE